MPRRCLQHQCNEVIHADSLCRERTMAVHADQAGWTKMSKIGQPHRQQHAHGRGQERQTHALAASAKGSLTLPPPLEWVHRARRTEATTVDGLDDFVERADVLKRDHRALER